MELNEKQMAQEEEYEIPYHYLSSSDKLIGFPQRLIASPIYLNYLRTIRDELIPFERQRILDAGCGDGRFCYEVLRENSDVQLFGIDYSIRAIGFAKIMNPNANFFAADLTMKLEFPDEFFDQIVSIETIEHIDPKNLPEVFSEIHRVLKVGGRFIITVPHTNRRLEKKHYQHFSSRGLSEIIDDYFNIVEIKGFHKCNWINNYIFNFIVILYYIFYPFRNFISYNLSRLGFLFFEKFLQACDPDDGYCLICIAKKSS